MTISAGMVSAAYKEEPKMKKQTKKTAAKVATAKKPVAKGGKSCGK